MPVGCTGQLPAADLERYTGSGQKALGILFKDQRAILLVK